MYYYPETGTIFKNHSEIRSFFYYVFFPAIITDADLAEQGVVLLVGTPPPMLATEVADVVGVILENGVWTKVFQVRPETEAENLQRVPQTLNRVQFKQILLIHKKLKLVPGVIAAIEDEFQREMYEIEWDDAQVFQRRRPFVIMLGEAFSLDLDELFVAGARL